MFEHQPDAPVVPLAMVRNSRAESWIMTVSNGTFLEPLRLGYVAERPAYVARVAQPAPARPRFGPVRTLRAIVARFFASLRKI
jgi:hypothetical protein